MIRAELVHNPYLLETAVLFNGQKPRINSQVEKYENASLKSWARSIPDVFFDEMNGYDFDLNYTGTASDFGQVRQAFERAGVSEEQVRLFHKNELEDVDTKCREIHALLQWMQEHPNRKLDIDSFLAEHMELFEESYPCVVIGGNQPAQKEPHIDIEVVERAEDVQNTVLQNMPIVFVVEKETGSFREALPRLLSREDVNQNQLFFLIRPALSVTQVVRILADMGVEDPQVVSDFYDEKILNYLRDYPITAYIREVIRIFEETGGAIIDVLNGEQEKKLQTNAEVHAEIDAYEKKIYKIKETDRLFTERDRYSAPAKFLEARKSLEQKIWKWQNWKTKITGDAEVERAARLFDQELRKELSEFKGIIKRASERNAAQIRERFHVIYEQQGTDMDYMPEIEAAEPEGEYIEQSVIEELLKLKVVYYEDPVGELVGMFMKTAPREPKRVVTCYYEQWRKKAVELMIPAADRIIAGSMDVLCRYYNDLAQDYHSHLMELMATLDTCKEQAAEKLSDEERRMQEDQDWLQAVRDRLTQIERG